MTAIQDEGVSPTIAAVSPTQAETLDLTWVGGSTVDDGTFLLSPAPRDSGFSPLWNLSVGVVAGMVNPILIDPSCVQLYVDSIRFDADSFSGFSTNQTTFRLEGPALCVVRQPGGVYVINETS